MNKIFRNILEEEKQCERERANMQSLSEWTRWTAENNLVKAMDRLSRLIGRLSDEDLVKYAEYRRSNR